MGLDDIFTTPHSILGGVLNDMSWRADGRMSGIARPGSFELLMCFVCCLYLVLFAILEQPRG